MLKKVLGFCSLAGFFVLWANYGRIELPGYPWWVIACGLSFVFALLVWPTLELSSVGRKLKAAKNEEQPTPEQPLPQPSEEQQMPAAVQQMVES